MLKEKAELTLKVTLGIALGVFGLMLAMSITRSEMLHLVAYSSYQYGVLIALGSAGLGIGVAWRATKE
jgi:hypothetical protein